MFTVIRAKTGIYVPVNPEDKLSVLRPIPAGQVCLIPLDFNLDAEKYDLVKMTEQKEEVKTEVKVKRAYNKKQK